MECGESSPLCFIRKKSGDDSPHSIRFAISVTAIVSNPVHPIDNRSKRKKPGGPTALLSLVRSVRLSLLAQLYFTKGDEHLCRTRRTTIRSFLSTQLHG